MLAGQRLRAAEQRFKRPQGRRLLRRRLRSFSVRQDTARAQGDADETVPVTRLDLETAHEGVLANEVEIMLEQPRRQDARSQGLDALGREVLLDEAGVWLQRRKVHPRDHSPVGVHPESVMGSARDRPTGELHDELSPFRRARRSSFGWQAVDSLGIGIRRNRRSCFCRSGLRRSWNGRRLGAIERQAGRNAQDSHHREGTTTNHPPPPASGDRHLRLDAHVVLNHCRSAI